MDLKLDPATHDLVFTNSVTVTESINEALSQKLKIKLLTFTEEWFLDTTYGVPYFQEIFGKSRDKNTIDTLFQKLIREEDLVQEIVQFQSTQTPDRTYSLSFRVKDKTGQLTDLIDIQIGGN
jgi:hypothetical protein